MGDCVDLWGTFWSSLRIYRKINRLFYQFRCCIIVERGLVDSKNCNLYFTGSGGFIWSRCPELRAQLITAIVRVLVKILFMRVWESPPVFFFEDIKLFTGFTELWFKKNIKLFCCVMKSLTSAQDRSVKLRTSIKAAAPELLKKKKYCDTLITIAGGVRLARIRSIYQEGLNHEAFNSHQCFLSNTSLLRIGGVVFQQQSRSSVYSSRNAILLVVVRVSAEGGYVTFAHFTPIISTIEQHKRLCVFTVWKTSSHGFILRTRPQ